MAYAVALSGPALAGKNERTLAKGETVNRSDDIRELGESLMMRWADLGGELGVDCGPYVEGSESSEALGVEKIVKRDGLWVSIHVTPAEDNHALWTYSATWHGGSVSGTIHYAWQDYDARPIAGGAILLGLIDEIAQTLAN